MEREERSRERSRPGIDREKETVRETLDGERGKTVREMERPRMDREKERP